MNSANNVLWVLFQNLTHPLPPQDTKLAPPLAELVFLDSKNSILVIAQPNSLWKKETLNITNLFGKSRYIFLFSPQKKKICCGYSLEAPQWGNEVLLMSTHNICFHGEIRKIVVIFGLYNYFNQNYFAHSLITPNVQPLFCWFANHTQ